MFKQPICVVVCFMFALALLVQDSQREKRFRQLDRNKDGKLTPDELRNEKAFKRLDKNGDGKITLEETTTKSNPPTPNQKAINPTKLLRPLTKNVLRDLDPVELSGADLPQLLGKSPSKIVAFRFQKSWEQVPIQIDERVKTGLARLRGRKGRGKDVQALVYADKDTVTGRDTDNKFDADDELVFMYKDTGNRSKGNDPKGVTPGSRIEFKIIDPVTSAERFLYLFVSDGSLKPDTGKDYVKYDFRLLKGQNFGPGPNPENSTIKTHRYKNHFSDRWIHDETCITIGNATGVDILDRDKFQFKPGMCNRTTKTFSLGGGGFIANIDGPVRAIRSVIGANSGALTQRDYICYEGRMLVRTFVRVHPIRGTWFFYDFSPEAKGMRYYDNLNLTGALVDGQPDELKTGVLDWQFLTGKQGSLTMAWVVDTNIPNLRRHSHYFDNVKPDWKQCTGDEFAYAASGPATGGLPDTDGGSKYHFVLDRVVYYDAPGMSVEQAKGRVTAAWLPLRVENLTKQ